MTDVVALDRFTVDCTIGILASEQCRTQPVEVVARLGLDLEPVAGGDLEAGVNYAEVQRQITFVLQYGSWRLLESAAFAIARLILAPPSPLELRGTVEELRLTLGKPTILEGAVPSITIERDALWCDLETRMVPPKTWVDVLQETPQTGAYRVHIEPGTEWKPPPGAACLVLGGELEADGKRVDNTGVIARGGAAEITNAGATTASLVVVSVPPMAD